MTPDEPSPTGWSGPAVLSFGFRPFFLLAGLWAALSMALWLVMLRTGLALPTHLDPVSWHAHAALYGYLGAVLPGFLLTAVPSWTGRPPLGGWTLLGLVVLWLLGRIAVAVSEYLPLLAVTLTDLAGLVIFGGILVREIVTAKNWRNLVVIVILGVFVAGNAVFHAEAAGGGHAASGYGLRIGLAAGIMLISLIGGRIVPAFTRNWLVERDGARLPAAFGPPDRLALVLNVPALSCWVAMPRGSVAGLLLLVTGLVQLGRLARWRGLSTWSEPLVWILHVGYAFIPVGMLALGTAILWPGSLTHAAAQHAWMAGAIGVMTLAVMTRASLGHTGRPLAAGAATTALYLLVIGSVVARLLSGVQPHWAQSLWTVSAILWTLGLAGFAIVYGRLLIGPVTR